MTQLAEIDAVVGREVEHQLAAVQRILGVDQLHLQLVGGDALLAHLEGGALVGAVLPHAADVHAVRQAQHRLDLARKAGVGQLMRGAHDLAALHAAGRLHDHIIPRGGRQAAGVKIIRTSAFLKAHRNYFS